MHIRLPDAFLHLQAQRLVFTHQFKKTAHQFIALILEQLMAAAGGQQLALEICQLHARGVHIEYRHAVTYFSI